MKKVAVFVVAGVISLSAGLGGGTAWAQTKPFDTSSLSVAVARATGPSSTTRWANDAFQTGQRPPRVPNWVKRHRAVFGALVGFSTGFFIGYLPGDDGVFDDFTAEFNGLVLGGIGALVGAVVAEAIP